MVNTNEIMRKIVKVMVNLENRLKVIEDNTKLLDDTNSKDQYVIYYNDNDNDNDKNWKFETYASFINSHDSNQSFNFFTWDDPAQGSFNLSLKNMKLKNVKNHQFFEISRTGYDSYSRIYISYNNKKIGLSNEVYYAHGGISITSISPNTLLEIIKIPSNGANSSSGNLVVSIGSDPSNFSCYKLVYSPSYPQSNLSPSYDEKLNCPEHGNDPWYYR